MCPPKMADAVGVDPTLARFGDVPPCRGSAGKMVVSDTSRVLVAIPLVGIGTLTDRRALRAKRGQLADSLGGNNMSPP